MDNAASKEMNLQQIFDLLMERKKVSIPFYSADGIGELNRFKQNMATYVSRRRAELRDLGMADEDIGVLKFSMQLKNPGVSHCKLTIWMEDKETKLYSVFVEDQE